MRPNIARDFVVSRDGRVTTLLMRRGMRWSDRAPFTADDIMFWYEDMYCDERVVASPSLALLVNGARVEVRRIDAHTLEFVSPHPYFCLAEVMAGYSDTTNAAGAVMGVDYARWFKSGGAEGVRPPMRSRI